MPSILEIITTLVRAFAAAKDVRERFFSYASCLLLLAVGAALLIAGVGFLVWSLYDGLAVVMASPNSARLVLSMLSFGLAGLLIWIAKKSLA